MADEQIRNEQIPNYIAAAAPVPQQERRPWYKNTAPTYAGIMLWFVFWSQMASGGTNQPGGVLSQGIGIAFLGLVVSALICHYLFYLVPGLLGLKTGLPLYIVGASTYGARGGFLMPAFLMGVLQFGWLGVNSYFSSNQIAAFIGGGETGGVMPKIIAVAFAVLAAFVGLKGIQYVASVATFVPLVPLSILVLLLAGTWDGLASFDADALVAAAAAGGADASALSTFGVLALCITYVVGFFATAGAAGVDFGMNNRHRGDVQMGGLVGIALAAIFAGGGALLIAAGNFGATGNPAMETANPDFMGAVMGGAGYGQTMGFLLALAAFPAGCFSSFIAANSFKTTMPNIKPAISVSVGTAVSILLAVTGWAGDVMGVFIVIGASFGPICGAMAADYWLAGKQWAGPRAGFNPAGWISWAVGFAVGMLPLIGVADIPAAPLVAFVIGFVLYAALAKLGLESAPLNLEKK